MKKYVFDSYAMFVYLEGESGAEKVASILSEALNDKAEVFMSVVNWGEVYYIVLREHGKEVSELYLKTIERYPIEIIDADKEITLEAGKIKSSHKLSYADAFAAAMAKIRKAHLVTGDKEFKSLGKQIKIDWL